MSGRDDGGTEPAGLPAGRPGDRPAETGSGAAPAGAWPVAADLDPVRRMRILASALPSVSYAEARLAVPFDRLWSYVADLETSMPALITDFRRFQPLGDRRFRATGLLGNRATFDVELRSGWCLMQSRWVVGGLAAVPDGDGTLFAGCGGLRFRGGGLLVAAIGGDRGARRLIRRLGAQLAPPR